MRRAIIIRDVITSPRRKNQRSTVLVFDYHLSGNYEG